MFDQRLSQPDSARFRLWELAGSSHVDASMIALGGIEVGRFVPVPPEGGLRAPAQRRPGELPDGQRARQLDRWVRAGVPAVSAPTASHSGTGNSGPSIQCQLSGTTTPFPPAELAARYPTHAAYVAAVSVAALRDVARGYLLPVDAAEAIKTAGSAPIPA